MLCHWPIILLVRHNLGKTIYSSLSVTRPCSMHINAVSTHRATSSVKRHILLCGTQIYKSVTRKSLDLDRTSDQVFRCLGDNVAMAVLTHDTAPSWTKKCPETYTTSLRPVPPLINDFNATDVADTESRNVSCSLYCVRVMLKRRSPREPSTAGPPAPAAAPEADAGCFIGRLR